MHVCDLTTLFIDTDGGGGVNTYLREKARYLAKRPGVEHTIVVPGSRDERSELHGATLHKIKSPRLPWNPVHRVLTRVRRAARLVAQLEPSVVEVDCVYFCGRAAARALRGRGVPLVGLYHAHLPTFLARPAFARLGRGVAGWVERRAWSYLRYCSAPCDRIVVTSPDIHDRLAAERFHRLVDIPLGVNTSLFRPRSDDTPRHGPVVLLYSGRLSHEKDLGVLFDAFARLREADGELAGEGADGYVLRIVGEGPLRPLVERAAAADPRIELVGPLPYGEQLAEQYAAADVFVNPSPNETFNLALFEAVASGLPVVAAARGGPASLVSAEMGWLARPGDAGDFAAKLSAAAARSRCRGDLGRGERARSLEGLRQRLGWERCFDRLLELYGELHGELGASAAVPELRPPGPPRAAFRAVPERRAAEGGVAR